MVRLLDFVRFSGTTRKPHRAPWSSFTGGFVGQAPGSNRAGAAFVVVPATSTRQAHAAVSLATPGAREPGRNTCEGAVIRRPLPPTTPVAPYYFSGVTAASLRWLARLRL